MCQNLWNLGCTSQFVKTVGSEAFFEFLEIRDLNFLQQKIGNSLR